MTHSIIIQCTDIQLAMSLHFVIYTQPVQPSSPFQMARKARSARMTQTSGKATRPRAKHANFS